MGEFLPLLTGCSIYSPKIPQDGKGGGGGSSPPPQKKIMDLHVHPPYHGEATFIPCHGLTHSLRWGHSSLWSTWSYPHPFAGELIGKCMGVHSGLTPSPQLGDSSSLLCMSFVVCQIRPGVLGGGRKSESSWMWRRGLERYQGQDKNKTIYGCPALCFTSLPNVSLTLQDM